MERAKRQVEDLTGPLRLRSHDRRRVRIGHLATSCRAFFTLKRRREHGTLPGEHTTDSGARRRVG